MFVIWRGLLLLGLQNIKEIRNVTSNNCTHFIRIQGRLNLRQNSSCCTIYRAVRWSLSLVLCACSMRCWGRVCNLRNCGVHLRRDWCHLKLRLRFVSLCSILRANKLSRLVILLVHSICGLSCVCTNSWLLSTSSMISVAWFSLSWFII